MRRPQRLFWEKPGSSYTFQITVTEMSKRYVPKYLLLPAIIYYSPYVFQRTFYYLDKLEIWEERIEEKRVEKMAFDWMIKNYADKDKDMLEEYSDF